MSKPIRCAAAGNGGFASPVRFRRAVEVHRSSRDLGTLALEAGYSDQAHFNRHFRFITGSAPGALMTSEEYY